MLMSQSFNDIRLMLNSSQILALAREGPLRLVTFDGDVTLVGCPWKNLTDYGAQYPDGHVSLHAIR